MPLARHAEPRRRSRYPWGSSFFGLTPENKVDVLLEPLFLLQYYSGFTYVEAYNLPVAYKRWWIDRISKEIARANQGEAPPGSRASHHDNSEVNALLGKSRSTAPARNRRF